MLGRKIIMILVTGGTGFIGSHTVVELQKNGYEVVIADNLVNSKIETLDNIEKITGIRPKFYLADVCDESAVEKIFSENDIEAFCGAQSGRRERIEAL